MSERLGEAVLELRTDDKAFDAGIKAAEGRARQLQRKFDEAGRRMQRLGVGLSAGVTAPIAALGATSVKAFMDHEKAVAGMEAALASMGDRAGFTSQQLQDMANQLELSQAVDADEVLSKVTANLLTFGNVANDEFARAQQAAVDLSARLGQDLQSSAIMVGKALNDPVQGLTALRRVGIQLTDEQEGLIKSFVATGDVAKAQGIILEELARQFGGQAAAQAATLDGQLRQLNLAWGAFQEQIGAVVAQVLPPLVEMLKGLVAWLQTLDPQTLAWAAAIGGVAAAIGPVVGGLGLMVSGIGALLPVIATLASALMTLVAASGPLGLLALAVSGIVVAWRNWDSIGPILQRLYEAAKEWLMDKLGAVLDFVGSKVEAVKVFFQDLYDAVVGNSYVPDMVDGIEREFGRLDGAMVEPAQAAADQVKKAFETIGDEIFGLLDNLLEDGELTFDDLRSAAVALIRDLRSMVFDSLKGALFGGSAGSGLLGTLFSSFAGGFAEGGVIPRGQWGIVGERGPEPVFAGRSPLTVSPAGGVTVTMNITTPDVDSFRRARGQVLAELARGVQRGGRNL